MKKDKFILVIGLFISINLFSQEVQFGDDIDNSFVGFESDLHLTVSGEFYLGAIDNDQGQVKVFKKVNNTWNSLDPGFLILDDDAYNVGIESSLGGDSLYIVYSKSDGVYTVIYDGTTFSSPFHFAGVVPSNSLAINGMKTVGNSNNGLVYITIVMDNEYKFLQFDPLVGLTALDDPLLHSHLSGETTDLAFNSSNGYLYFAYIIDSKPAIILYNGSNWVPYKTNVSGQSSAYYTGVKLDVSESENRLYVCLSVHYNGLFYYRICYINLITNGIVIIEDQVDTGFNNSINGGFYNDAFGDVVVSLKGINSGIEYSILYFDGTNSGVALDVANMDKFSDMHPDSDGNIYWAVDDDYLKVFKLEKFNAEIESNTNFNFNVFPNPTSEVLNITWDYYTGETPLLVYNSEGRLIKEIILQGYTGNYSVDISDFPTGTYFIRYQQGFKKIVKI